MCSYRNKLLYILICNFWLTLKAQDKKPFDNNFSCKFSFYSFIGGGTGAGISLGIWKGFKTHKEVNVIQPALNISSIFAFGKSHLGNNGRKGTQFQWNLVLSPMISTTFHWRDSTKTGIYEELNPLYLNNASAIYCNYRSGLTIGTSFITTPKGFGRNYITSRNRSQQLAFFQLKGGFGNKTSIQFNLIEDVGPQFLADKWDRFFTGGGSIQVRYNYLKAKVFSEVYTGTTQRDMVDFPDITIPDDSTGGNLWLGVRREKIYALQEASQKTYNNGRTIYALEIDNKLFTPQKDSYINDFSHNFYFYTQGGPDMWSQNMIHSYDNGDIQKVIQKGLPKDTVPFKGKNTNSSFLMPKHFFEPFYSNRTRGIGYGINYNFAH